MIITSILSVLTAKCFHYIIIISIKTKCLIFSKLMTLRLTLFLLSFYQYMDEKKLENPTIKQQQMFEKDVDKDHQISVDELWEQWTLSKGLFLSLLLMLDVVINIWFLIHILFITDSF